MLRFLAFQTAKTLSMIPPARPGGILGSDLARESQTDGITTFLIHNKGRLTFDGSPNDLVHSRDSSVREFLG